MATTDTYAYDPLGGYATNPTPQTGSGAYGSVPGAIQIPPNIYQQIGTIDPDLANQTGTMNTTILNELQGQLSPETISAIQQNAAQFGVATGMPGSQFAGNYGLEQLGQSVEKQQQQGESDYLKMLQGTGATLTPQQLAAQIASSNATMAAAPNPTQAAQQQMSDWQNKFNQAAGGGGIRPGNPAGGTGAGMNLSNLGYGGGGGGSAGGGNPSLSTAAYDYTSNGWQRYGSGWIDPNSGQTYDNFANPTGQLSETGAGTWGSTGQAMAAGKYTDPQTGTQYTWDPTQGAWYNWSTDDYVNNLPTQTLAQPTNTDMGLPQDTTYNQQTDTYDYTPSYYGGYSASESPVYSGPSYNDYGSGGVPSDTYYNQGTDTYDYGGPSYYDTGGSTDFLSPSYYGLE